MEYYYITSPNDAAFARPDTENTVDSFGLTKREYLAAMAFQGMLACCADKVADSTIAKAIAEASVEYADILINALNGEAERDNNMDA